jgi:succinoglycan biosynthesis transport protein ExoP
MNAPHDPSSLPGRRRRSFDIGNLLLGRGLAVLAAGALLFVLGSPLAFLKRAPYYHTGGSLLVSPKVQQVLSRQENIIHGSFQDFADTQAQRLMTNEVLARALDELPKEEWPSFLQSSVTSDEAAKVLRTRIQTSPVARSYLLFVGITGERPEGLAETVNAVMRSYIGKLESEQESQSRRRLDYLKSEKEAILGDIDARKTRQVELSKELKSRTFNDLNNPYYESVLSLQEQYILAQARELQEKSELDRTEREEALLSELNLNVLADDAVSRNEAVYLIDNWTYQKLQELRGKIDGLTPENPDRIYVEERMKAMDEYLVNFKKQLHTDFHRILTEKRALEFDEAEARARSAQEASADLTKKLRQAMDDAAEAYHRSTELIAEGQEINNDIDLLRGRLSLVEESIRDVSLDAKAPTHVSVEEKALTPTGAASDNLMKYLAMIFVGAFGVAGSVAVALELLDGRVRGVRDLQSALGVAPPDAIADFPRAAGTTDAELCVYRRPDHAASVAIRKLAVRLNRERDRNGGRTFLFTGASAGSDSAMLAHNTAAALTQYLDRVLFVRVDGTEARLSNRPEFSRQTVTEMEIVKAGLDRIDLGSRVATLELDASDPVLENRARFITLLRKAAEYFQAIVIESGQVLESDLTQYLVHQVEVTVIVARHCETPYARLRASIEFLYQSSIPAFSAVLVGSASSPVDQLLQWRDGLMHWVNDGGLRQFVRTLRERGLSGWGGAVARPQRAKSVAS